MRMAPASRYLTATSAIASPSKFTRSMRVGTRSTCRGLRPAATIAIVTAEGEETPLLLPLPSSAMGSAAPPPAACFVC